jgi:hypothetical protein
MDKSSMAMTSKSSSSAATALVVATHVGTPPPLTAAIRGLLLKGAFY